MNHGRSLQVNFLCMICLSCFRGKLENLQSYHEIVPQMIRMNLLIGSLIYITLYYFSCQSNVGNFLLLSTYRIACFQSSLFRLASGCIMIIHDSMMPKPSQLESMLQMDWLFRRNRKNGLLKVNAQKNALRYLLVLYSFYFIQFSV